jgi:hypothetical protein
MRVVVIGVCPEIGMRFAAGLGRRWFSESKLLQLDAGLLEWNEGPFPVYRKSRGDL